MMGTCGSEDEGPAALFDAEQAERKKIEQALRESERKYQKLIKYAPAAIYEIDFQKNRFTSVNDAMCLMSGYNREELLAMVPLDIMSRQSGVTFKKRLEQWLNGEEPEHNVDYTVTKKDGSEACVALNVSFTRDENGAPLGATAVAQDITERKQAEEALRRIAEELKKKEEETLELIDGFTEGSWIVDRLEGTIKCSEKWAKRIGLDEVPEKERLAYTHTLVHPDDTADGNSIEHCMEAGMPRFDLEYRVKTVDSGYIWTQNRGKIAYDGQGRAAKVYAATIDITERKKAEEALYERTNELEEANRQKEDILESISDCFYVLDKNLRFTYVNKPAEEIWGLSRADLIGRKIEDIFPGIIDISLSKFHQVLLERSRQHYEVYSKVIGRWGDMGVYPIRDGISVYFRDTTERKKAEEALRESEERFRTVQDNSLDRFSILKPIFNDSGDIIDFTYVYHNAQASRIVGRRPDEMIGKRVSEIFPTFSKTRFFTIYKQVIGTGQVLEIEDRYNFDGVDEWFRATLTPVPDGIAIAAHSINERKKAEEALQASEKKAITLVKELEKADQNKNEFLSALSHELRNPLAAISAGLQLLDITNDEKQAKTAKEIMNRQMDQLCRLVDELLDLTRISNNKITLKKECVDINRLIQLSANDHRPLFDKKRLKFNVTPCSEKLLAEADPVRVKQITSNLLHNAFKFSNEGGEVTLSAYEQDGYAVICVKDSGIGISYDDLPKLFKPFAQIDNNIERANGGLGLGLSIVKGIARLHGGDAEAASEGEGRGASFLIKLPLDKNVNGQRARDAAPAVSTVKLKVLFIEDNKDYSEMFCAMMGILGCEVAAAPDGAQGLKKAKEYLPDVVICDIGLPGMNGYEVAMALRNDEATKRMFMVALTGYARPQDIEAALAAGFDRHMAKPVSMEALKQILGAARQ